MARQHPKALILSRLGNTTKRNNKLTQREREREEARAVAKEIFRYSSESLRKALEDLKSSLETVVRETVTSCNAKGK